MLVGPTAVGKSTVMNEAVRRDKDFVRATGFTTRPQRANDEPGQYRYVDAASLQSLIDQGHVLQYVTNPGNGQTYGTSLEDYPGRFNMKDTLSLAVQEFTRLPFKDHLVISLTVPPDTWKEWLYARYPQPSAERTERLLEAKSSLEWSLRQTNAHHWLINCRGAVGDVADQLIAMSRHPDYDMPVPTEPVKMLEMIDDLLSYG